MTEKRFKLHIEFYNPEKTDGEATLKEIGQPMGVINSIEDARFIRDTLNELYDENRQLQKDNRRLRIKIDSLNENFNRLNKLFNDIEDPDYELMSEYMEIIRKLI